MKSAVVTIAGLSPYSQSRAHEAPHLEKELHDDYKIRTWREHLHVDKATRRVFIPPSSLSNAIKECAKYLSIQIPGKGKATYTKHFEAGLMIAEGILLDVKPEDVDYDRLYLNSDGKVGSGPRVWKYFPRIDPPWGGTFTVLIADDVITLPPFETIMRATGQLIGIGRFRPRNRGYYGRFQVKSIVWREESETLAAMSV